MDKQDNITWVNKAFEDYSQLGIENLIGNHFNDVLADLEVPAQMLDIINERKARIETFAIEVTHYLPYCGRQWLEIEYTPLFDSLSKHTGYIAVHQKITSRKEKEERVNQQNKTLQEIAWLSSHEVRRPVASILGLVYLAKDVQTEHEREEIFEMINHCAQELDSIVHVISERVNENLDLTSAAHGG
ncbi:PAS domain S-box protein [Mucilaginibacter terrae]|uniref:histidine kinase n=1 Tax=Mucilaginibacter terrae TaxID=1955052 RepID=A0ABU3GNP1_9SPHI|nr:PAS domain S-box protein [Mucilaginibacter terrae]MDT3401403.1 PAS domain S-box-containing protein [Mucilaginibacter terrae]